MPWKGYFKRRASPAFVEPISIMAVEYIDSPEMKRKKTWYMTSNPIFDFMQEDRWEPILVRKKLRCFEPVSRDNPWYDGPVDFWEQRTFAISDR